MKKRVLALALATVMSLGIVASVAADDIESAGGSTTGEVTAEVTAMQEPKEATYLVTVKFSDLAFTYNMGNVGEWSTTDLKYAAPTDAGWDGDRNTATVTVTNKSNAAVKLDCKYAEAEGGLTGNFDKTEATLDSAVNKENLLEAGTPKADTFTLTLDTPEKAFSGKAGTITLTVNAVE